MKKDEPYIFGLQEQNLEQLIMSKGFSWVNNFTAPRIKTMYFIEMARAEKLHPFWGIIQAIV